MGSQKILDTRASGTRPRCNFCHRPLLSLSGSMFSLPAMKSITSFSERKFAVSGPRKSTPIRRWHSAMAAFHRWVLGSSMGSSRTVIVGATGSVGTTVDIAEESAGGVTEEPVLEGEVASGEVSDAAEGADCAGGGVRLRTEGVRLLHRRRSEEGTLSQSPRRRPRADEGDGEGERDIIEIGAATMVVVGKNERRASHDTACQPRGHDVAQLLDIAEWQAARSVDYWEAMRTP